MSGMTGECNLCKRPATLRCSTCHSTYYCGKDHQRSDWIRHKAECKTYEVRFSPDLGRHLVAAKDLQEGDVILTQNPSLIGPMEMSSAYHCVGCYRALKQMETRCHGCRLPVCKLTCPGLKDSAGHELECAIFKKCPGPPKNTIWPILGIFFRCMSLQKACPEMWQWIAERSPYAARKRVSKYSSTRYLMISMWRPVLQNFAYYGGERLDASLETFDKVIDVLDVFSFDIFLNENDKVCALYPTASLLQQSCIPNTRLSFVGKATENLKIGRVTVTAARIISKGEVLSYTSLPTSMSTLARQGHLLQNRSMRCSCIRCLDPRELGTDFGTIKCSTCSGWILPVNTVDIVGSQWKCQGRCKQELSNDDAASRQVKLLKRMSTVISGKQVTLKKLEMLLKVFERNFHPNNWSCVHLKHAMMKAYSIAPALLKDKKHFALTMESHGIALNPVNKVPVARLERKAALCRDILDVWDQISAGVFVDDVIPTADVLLNLASAEAALMRQKFASRKIDRDEIVAALERCQALLSRAENLLSTKSPDTLSEIVAKDIETVQETLATWASENGFLDTEEPLQKVAKFA